MSQLRLDKTATGGGSAYATHICLLWERWMERCEVLSRYSCELCETWHEWGTAGAPVGGAGDVTVTIQITFNIWMAMTLGISDSQFVFCRTGAKQWCECNTITLLYTALCIHSYGRKALRYSCYNWNPETALVRRTSLARLRHDAWNPSR